jgi:hypothetical protein
MIWKFWLHVYAANQPWPIMQFLTVCPHHGRVPKAIAASWHHRPGDPALRKRALIVFLSAPSLSVLRPGSAAAIAIAACDD